MTSIRNFLAVAVAAAITAGGAFILAPTANAQPAQILIRPKQYFAGQVNGNSGSSVLSVLGCPTPSVTPVSATGAVADGHPMPGQTVSAEWFKVPPPVPVGSDWLGYTGKAQKISVDLITNWVEPPISELTHITDLTTYNTPFAIPTTLSLPCNATYQMAFMPVNGAKFALSSTVTLTRMSPRIVTILPPTAVGVNTVVLHGTGFVPATTYTLAECSQTNWIVPQSPCLSANTVTATTDTTGVFSTPFTPLPCTNVVPSTCYAGAPTPTGIDTVTLAGADKLVVS